MSAETAEQYYKQGNMMLYALHPDGTESVVGNEKQFQRHSEPGGLFGVEKQDWMKYLEKEEYLHAAEVSEEQNYNIIDGRNNNRVAKKDASAQSKKSERDMQYVRWRQDGAVRALSCPCFFVFIENFRFRNLDFLKT